MKYGQNHLERAPVLLFVHAGRNASSIVLNPDGIAFEYAYVNGVAIPAHSFVYTVVNHFIYKVVQTSFGNVSNVH